jgi:hypothetical protein
LFIRDWIRLGRSIEIILDAYLAAFTAAADPPASVAAVQDRIRAREAGAAAALGDLFALGDAAVPVLLERHATEAARPRARTLIRRALAGLGATGLSSLRAILAAEPSPGARARIADEVSDAAPPGASAWLLAVAGSDPDGAVRALALSRLRRDRESKPRLEALAAGDPDERARIEAKAALRR